MDLVPETLVVGVTAAQTAPGDLVNAERINRIWSELAPRYGFTALQMAPDQKAAMFVGATPDDGVILQPPIMQVREGITGTPVQSHERAQELLRVIVRNLGPHQLFQLGVRHVYTGPLSTNDARAFLRNQVLSHGGEHLEELGDESTLWGGVKYVIQQPHGAVFTLIIEPKQADEMRSLYIDLDAQFAGPITIDTVTSRARDAQDYVNGSVARYLDGLLSGG